MRGARLGFAFIDKYFPIYLFQSNAPRAGCNSKTIQSKCVLIARRMYIFANYVLHILKHSPTYCIGTTLQPLIFGAMLPVILCKLNVRTIFITLLYHTSLLPASAFAAIKSHRPNGVMRVKYTWWRYCQLFARLHRLDDRHIHYALCPSKIRRAQAIYRLEHGNQPCARVSPTV